MLLHTATRHSSRLKLLTLCWPSADLSGQASAELESHGSIDIVQTCLPLTNQQIHAGGAFAHFRTGYKAAGHVRQVSFVGNKDARILTAF